MLSEQFTLLMRATIASLLQQYRKNPSTADSIPKPPGERVGFLASNYSLGVVTGLCGQRNDEKHLLACIPGRNGAVGSYYGGSNLRAARLSADGTIQCNSAGEALLTGREQRIL